MSMGGAMDADRIIDALPTLTAADLRRVLARAQELAAIYDDWQQPEDGEGDTGCGRSALHPRGAGA